MLRREADIECQVIEANARAQVMPARRNLLAKAAIVFIVKAGQANAERG